MKKKQAFSGNTNTWNFKMKFLLKTIYVFNAEVLVFFAEDRLWKIMKITIYSFKVKDICLLKQNL